MAKRTHSRHNIHPPHKRQRKNLKICSCQHNTKPPERSIRGYFVVASFESWFEKTKPPNKAVTLGMHNHAAKARISLWTKLIDEYKTEINGARRVHAKRYANHAGENHCHEGLFLMNWIKFSEATSHRNVSQQLHGYSPCGLCPRWSPRNRWLGSTSTRVVELRRWKSEEAWRY